MTALRWLEGLAAGCAVSMPETLAFALYLLAGWLA